MNHLDSKSPLDPARLHDDGIWAIVAALNLLAIASSALFFLTLAINWLWPQARSAFLDTGMPGGMMAALSSIMAVLLAARFGLNERRKQLTVRAFLIGWAPAVVALVVAIVLF